VRVSLPASGLVAARVAIALVRGAPSLVAERLRRLAPIALAAARGRAGLIVTSRPAPINALATAGLLVAVTRGAAAAVRVVLAILALLMILAGIAVAVALSALVPEGLSIIWLARPPRA
jgi:hypothetical protein